MFRRNARADKGIRGWVCIINLGADATFAWRHGGQSALVHRERLVSGDAILFNGEIIEHAIEQIHLDVPPPPFWCETMEALQGGSRFLRVGLQMRA